MCPLDSFGVLRRLPANCAAVSGNLVAAFWLHLSTETWFHLTLKLVVEIGEQTPVLCRKIILTYGFVEKFRSEFCDCCQSDFPCANWMLFTNLNDTVT